MVFKLYISVFITALSVAKPTDNWNIITVDEMSKEIKKIEAFYKNTPAYSVSVTHASYKSYTATSSEDKMNGYFMKDAKNNYHSYVLGIHSVQNNKIKITVDSLNKSILINEPDKAFTKEVKVKEIEQMLKICTSVKKQNGTEISKYRFEFGKGTQYAAYEIWVNMDSRLQKIILYFNAEFPSDPDNDKSVKTKPRAEIVFSNYKTGIKPVYKDHFDETKYIKLSGDKYIPTEKFKNYKVYDLRAKTK